MTAQIPSADRPSDATLAAFLGQIGPRAAVLAELACGDAERGDAAVAAAMRAFRNSLARGTVAGTPDAEWATLFWSLQLAAPQLRRQSDDGHWPAPLAGLAALGRGLRAAILLRLVAGLDDGQAARVLRVAPATVAAAIACANRQSGDAGLLARVADDIELRVRQLPARRLVRLAALREQAGHATAQASRPRRRRMGMAVAAAACALAFAATFLPVDSGSGDPRIRTIALSAADAPASTYDADTALLTHRDFEQLADTRNAALVRDLDFYAWYAAKVAAGDATPMLMPDAARPLPALPPGSPHASH